MKKILSLFLIVIISISSFSCQHKKENNTTDSIVTIGNTDLQENDDYSSYLKEAQKNYDDIMSQLESCFSYTSSYKKCTASDETIINACFDALKTTMKNPLTAELLAYSTPEKDDYGRVICLLGCVCSNDFGVPKEVDKIVLLQSCSSTGKYTYQTTYFTSDANKASGMKLMILNDWGKDPDVDDKYEEKYQEAISRIKQNDFMVAKNRLLDCKGYKNSSTILKLIDKASDAQSYLEAVKLFDNGDYINAKKALEPISSYSKSLELIELCDKLHVHSFEHHEGKDASCTEDGYNEYDTCECGYSSKEIIKAFGHDYEEEIITEATCTSPSENIRKCKNCGLEVKKTISKELGHAFEETEHVEPSCTNDGYIIRKCSRCGCEEKETLKATGHKWVSKTSVVHHEETGHYEEIKVGRELVVQWRCYGCKEWFNSKDEVKEHYQNCHSEADVHDYSTILYAWGGTDGHHRDTYVDIYENEWIVDQAAYDETVIIEQKCSVCGAVQ